MGQSDWELTTADVEFALMHSVPSKAPGHDMWSPWHWQHLPPTLRNEAVRLTQRWPREATHSHPLWTTLYVLIPKPGGGLRPIGLTMGLVRAYSKAAAHAMRHLDRSLDTHLQIGHRGAPCDRAALTCLLRAEAALAQQLEFVSVLLDVSKAYERVRHSELLRTGREKGLPETFLCGLLGVYSTCKCLTFEGQAADPEFFAGISM
eukprot:5968867-Amphidinium_carterae.1